MSKVVLDDVISGYGLSKINENFQKIEDELNNKVLYRDNPVDEINTIEQDLDLNGFSLYNVEEINGVAVDTFTENVDIVAGSIASVNTVATNIANVNIVAGIDDDVTDVAAVADDVSILAPYAPDVGAYATGIYNNLASSATGKGAELVALDDGAGGALWTTVKGFVEKARSQAGASLVGSDDGDSGSKWTTVKGMIAYLMSSLGASIVGFIQSGIGAVARWVQDKLREQKSVLDFMSEAERDDVLSGSPVLDHTASCQKALDALSEGQKLIFIGAIRVSGNLTLSVSNVELEGRHCSITQTGTAKKTLYLNGVTGVTVRGFRLIGKGTEFNGASHSYNGVAGIYLHNCSNCDVVSNTLTNHAGGGIRWGKNISSVNIINNRIAGIGSAGGIVAGDNGSDIAVGTAVVGTEVRIRISGNDISGHAFGVYSWGGVDNSITNNDIHDIPGQHGCYLVDQTRMNVVANRFSNITYIAIKFQIDTLNFVANDTVVLDNNVYVAQSGIAFGYATGGAGGVWVSPKVCNNKIKNVSSYGIYFDSASKIDCSLNTIVGCSAYSIYIPKGNGHVRFNTVRDSNWLAVYALIDGTLRLTNNDFVDFVLNAEAAASGPQYNFGVYIAKNSSSAVSNPIFDCFDNTFDFTVAEPTLYLKAVRTDPSVSVYFDRNINRTTKGWQFASSGEVKLVNFGYSPNADFSATANLNPATPIYGHGRRTVYGAQTPAAAGMTDFFRAGDRCINADPTLGEPSEWKCSGQGFPGTWRVAGQNGVAKGVSASRPTKTTMGVLNDSDWAGVMYFDTTLDADGKPIWWTGSAWVDATGAVV